MTNVNAEIFSRLGGKKKLAMVNSLTNNEVLMATKDTILKMVKEIGYNKSKSFKVMNINRKRRVGNGWNSTIEGVELIEGKLYLDVYVQFDHTDTNYSVEFTKFFRSGEFHDVIDDEYDAYGRCGSCHIRYDMDDKVKVMRSILLEYVNYKYIEKAERERRELANKLKAESSAVTQEYYKDWNIYKKDSFLGKYSSYNDVLYVEGYSASRKALGKYIEDNVKAIAKMPKDEALKVYREVFLNAFEEFKPTFDFSKWRKERYW